MYDTGGNCFYSDLNVIKIDCSDEELFCAMDLFNEKKVVLPVLRSFLHEHTHFIQYNTTPVGYYLKLLGSYQMAYLQKIASEMLKSPEFTYPMMLHIQLRKNEKDRFKRPIHFYYYWYLAEVIRVYLTGERETFDYYLQKVMHGEFYGIFDFILELEPELVKILNPAYPYTGRKLTAMKNEEQKNAFKTSVLLKNTVMKMGIKDLLESQALLSEYYYDDIADERLLKALEKKEFSSNQVDYLFPLILYRSLYSFDLTNKKDFLRFKLGFHAVCQIALHAPVLPFHDKLGPLHTGDLEIDMRLPYLLNARRKISPPESLGDYDRYIDEMTRQNGYKSLESVSKSIFENREMIQNNIMRKVFRSKQERLFIGAQKIFLKDKSEFYRFLGGTASSPGMFYFKFTGKGPALDEDGVMNFYYDLLYQYYKELLMGYNAKNSPDAIMVSPAVELNRSHMDILKEAVELFNSTRSKSFPEMVWRKDE